MRLKLFDLLFETLPMRPVLRCVDRFPFERRVLGPQCVDLATKAIVLGFDVFSLAHVPVVTMQGLGRRRPSRASAPTTVRDCIRSPHEARQATNVTSSRSRIHQLTNVQQLSTLQTAEDDDRCEGRPT